MKQELEKNTEEVKSAFASPINKTEQLEKLKISYEEAEKKLEKLERAKEGLTNEK